MENISFAGFTYQSGPQSTFSDSFDVNFDDDGTFIAVSKETFRHEEEDLNFNYKYVIEMLDMRAYDESTIGNNIFCYLYLVPTIDSCCTEYIESLINFTGVPEEDITYYDMLSNGGAAVEMAHEEWQCEEEMYPLENEKCKSVLNAISTIMPMIDSMRGMYLDRPWNMIGSDGWDTIKHAVKNEDLIRRSLMKMKIDNKIAELQK